MLPLSVCIPAYNRPEYLDDLMTTIVSQDFKDYEIVVSEDNSPRTNEIQTVVDKYKKNYPEIQINFFRNKVTLGYDGNFRSTIKKAKGKYCVFMGDDDLLCQGALKKIHNVIKNNPSNEFGVILRSWARAERESKVIVQDHKYFNSDRYFSKGIESAVCLFRRSVAIAGYTVNRDLALKFETDKFDGTLLYQLYLTGAILSIADGYYISDIIAIMRKDIDQKPTHFFGTAKAEKANFNPGILGPQNSINFMNGMFDIAKYLEEEFKMSGMLKSVQQDVGNYSFPILSLHYDKGLRSMFFYYKELGKIGFNRSKYFHLYFFSLILFGKKNCEKIISLIKSVYKSTPIIGDIKQGRHVE